MPEILPDQVATGSLGGAATGAAAAGISPATNASAAGAAGAVIQDTFVVATDAQGKTINYTMVVVVPVPFFNLNLNLNLLGDFVMPALTALRVPKAMTWFTNHLNDVMQQVFEDVRLLISAIPEMTVEVVVKFGSVIVFNLVFVAVKEPVVVTTPSFQLAAPNFAVDTQLSTGIGIPAGNPIVISVPIPWPVYNQVPLVGVSGGNVSATAQGSATTVGQAGISGATTGAASGAGVAVSAPSVTSPIRLPVT